MHKYYKVNVDRTIRYHSGMYTVRHKSNVIAKEGDIQWAHNCSIQ